MSTDQNVFESLAPLVAPAVNAAALGALLVFLLKDKVKAALGERSASVGRDLADLEKQSKEIEGKLAEIDRVLATFDQVLEEKRRQEQTTIQKQKLDWEKRGQAQLERMKLEADSAGIDASRDLAKKMKRMAVSKVLEGVKSQVANYVASGETTQVGEQYRKEFESGLSRLA